MAAILSALAMGLMLGLGLCVSSMTNPQKVLNFLDVAGPWDPSLLLVLGSAVCVAFAGFRLTRLMPGPLFAERFQFPHRTDIDFHLFVGPALFGIGWGLGGVCPGPGLQLIVTAPESAVWFVPALLVGLWIGRPHHRRARARAAERSGTGVSV